MNFEGRSNNSQRSKKKISVETWGYNSCASAMLKQANMKMGQKCNKS
jgi:hypothetical protein